jgi:Mn-containing catalase
MLNGIGGQFGKIRTRIQNFFQNMNLRGDAKPYQDLLQSMATEEIGHVEQITNTINVLLDGASKIIGLWDYHNLKIQFDCDKYISIPYIVFYNIVMIAIPINMIYVGVCFCN